MGFYCNVFQNPNNVKDSLKRFQVLHPHIFILHSSNPCETSCKAPASVDRSTCCTIRHHLNFIYECKTYTFVTVASGKQCVLQYMESNQHHIHK